MLYGPLCINVPDWTGSGITLKLLAFKALILQTPKMIDASISSNAMVTLKVDEVVLENGAAKKAISII